MKVGDLVKLSARGKKLQRHNWLAEQDPIGIVIKVDTWYSIHVQWTDYTPHYGKDMSYYRHDLKYAK